MNKQPNLGESDLDTLVQSMQPILHDGVFVFVALDASFSGELPSAMMVFQEQEGKTLIVHQDDAELYGFDDEFPCRMITLNVHSALAAVGFLARITQQLAQKNISVNPVSAFYHDHLFVPVDRAEDALKILRQMIVDSQQG